MRMHTGTSTFESIMSLSNKVALKDSGEGKSSQWSEFREAHLVVQFALREKVPGLKIHMGS